MFSRVQLPFSEEDAAASLAEAVSQEMAAACAVLRIGPKESCHTLASHAAEPSTASSADRLAPLARAQELDGEPVLVEELLHDGLLGVVVPGWLQERWMLVVEGVRPPLDRATQDLLLEIGWIARTALGAGDLLARGVRARHSADAASHRVIAVSRLIELLPSRLDLDETVSSVLDAVVPYVGDWAVLFLVSPAGRLERTAARHLSAPAQAALSEATCFPLPPAPEDQAGWLAGDGPFSLGSGAGGGADWPLRDDERELVLREVSPLTGIAAPLRRGDNVVGLLVVGTSEGGQVYGRDEVRLLRELAKLARVALESALLFAAAERATKQREEVLAIVSHDLRNPLQTLRYAAMHLGLPKLDPDKRSQQLALVERSVETMERLLQDLLDVSRMEAGRFTVEPRPYPAARLLEEACRSFSTPADEKGVTLDLRAAPAVEVWADREGALRVLANLLSNAISFTPRGGRVVLAAEAAEEAVWFVVRDTGPGIAPELLPHVFDRYWQANRAARSGAGLGLAIAKGIVEAHEGEIVARSLAEGGAEFRFRLPLVSPAREHQEN